MDFENKLQNFWGYIPTFHDDDITGIFLNDKMLQLDITTRTNKVLHPEHIYKAFERVTTTLKFESVIISRHRILCSKS